MLGMGPTCLSDTAASPARTACHGAASDRAWHHARWLNREPALATSSTMQMWGGARQAPSTV